VGRPLWLPSALLLGQSKYGFAGLQKRFLIPMRSSILNALLYFKGGRNFRIYFYGFIENF
jgi:hypothetical protein